MSGQGRGHGARELGRRGCDMVEMRMSGQGSGHGERKLGRRRRCERAKEACQGRGGDMGRGSYGGEGGVT